MKKILDYYKRLKNKRYDIYCVLLGAIFISFGLNGFFDFFKIPTTPRGDFFLGYLKANDWIYPMIKSVEIAAGLMFLTRSYVPLAAILLAPILANIVAFHICLDLVGLPFAILLVAFYLYITYCHRDLFKKFLQRN